MHSSLQPYVIHFQAGLDPHNQKKGDANQSRNQVKKAKAKLKS